MTSKVCIFLRTWFVLPCPSLPQQSSQHFCIFRVAKNYRIPFRRPLLLAFRGIYAPTYPQPAAIVLRMISQLNNWLLLLCVCLLEVERKVMSSAYITNWPTFHCLQCYRIKLFIMLSKIASRTVFTNLHRTRFNYVFVFITYCNTVDNMPK